MSSMKQCSICNNTAVFKVKNENIYYCKEHAEEFFDIDSLEIISDKIKLGANQANILKKFLNN